MSAMMNFFNNKSIENDLADVSYNFDTKVMKRDRVNYYSYLITSFTGTRYLVPIDCYVYVPYVKGTFQKSITTSIINLVNQVENINCYPILSNNTFTFVIKGKTEVKNNFSIAILNKDNTIEELEDSSVIKLRSSEELLKLLSKEEEKISAAIKKAEYESLDNPFTKWWMEQDEKELKTESSFGL